MTMDPHSRVADLIFARWKSRILYAGVKLGTIEALKPGPKSAAAIANELDLEPALGYRLLRAMASIGLLAERQNHIFELTPEGCCLLADHPASLRDVAVLQDGPEHSAIWKHLPEMVRDGRQNGFVREFGHSAFEHADADPEYAATFQAAMTSYSTMQTNAVVETLRDFDFSPFHTVCDIGGGHGHLLCGILTAHPHLKGIVLERPRAIENLSLLWANRLGLEDRCHYVAGDLFREIPAADLYLLKLVLHDWSDHESVRILANARRVAAPGSRIFLIEHVVPGPETPHFAKLYDIHMMCWGNGRERTAPEYARLLEAAGWGYAGMRPVADGLMGLVEGVSEA
jgi:SAM-dependent methyltransferase